MIQVQIAKSIRMVTASAMHKKIHFVHLQQFPTLMEMELTMVVRLRTVAIRVTHVVQITHHLIVQLVFTFLLRLLQMEQVTQKMMFTKLL